MCMISSAIIKWLVRERIIKTDDQHLYMFAVYSLFWGLLPLFLTILLGIAFGMVKEGIIFILPYILLRKFCGGYHLQTPGACILVSSLVIFVSLVFIHYTETSTNWGLLSFLVICSLVSIYIHSPIDSKARSLSTKEMKVFRTISKIISFIFLLLYVCFIIIRNLAIAVPFGTGIIISGLLQLPCLWMKD